MDRIRDMKELIRQEIQSISSLEERVAFKSLMEQVFLELYETNEQMYLGLEKRIQEELSYDVNRYQIKTGMVERIFYDATHHEMCPMDIEDVEREAYTMKDIVETVREGREFPIMKVMLKGDYMEIRDVWNHGVQLEGTIETENPETIWTIHVTLRKNIKYLKQISHLYQLFTKNGIPWQTINAPYLYKMADVVISDLPDGIKGDEVIKRIEINFGKYSRMICHNLIPIWNIQKLVLDSVGFPVPCEDHKNYEHRISIHEYGNNHAYLADDTMEIRSISQREDKLIVVSGASEAKKWNIYMIRNSGNSKIDQFTYPIMQNERTENFLERFQRRWNQTIRTRAELARFIKGFGLEEYIVYQGCEIKDQFEQKKETYSMNSFIEDEIRDTKAQKKLLLYFKAGEKESWLQRDVASFVVSEVQRLYPEYECGGKLV